MTAQINGFGLGCIPDHPDQRDFMLQTPLTRAKLPASADNESLAPPIWDQGPVGACTAFGTLRVAAISEKHQATIRPQTISPSFLFQYWNTRYLEGTVTSDAGGMIRDALKAMAKWGVASEADWPYIADRFIQKPPQDAFDHALQERARLYARVPMDLYSIRYPISKGYAVAIGVSLYESFASKETEKTGKVTMPEAGERMIGGHCMCALGYRDDIQCAKVANSWTRDWGERGHCWIPYAYLTDPNLAADFWTIRKVD